jgi:hypothetical protein
MWSNITTWCIRCETDIVGSQTTLQRLTRYITGNRILKSLDSLLGGIHGEKGFSAAGIAEENTAFPDTQCLKSIITYRYYRSMEAC